MHTFYWLRKSQWPSFLKGHCQGWQASKLKPGLENTFFKCLPDSGKIYQPAKARAVRLLKCQQQFMPKIPEWPSLILCPAEAAGLPMLPGPCCILTEVRSSRSKDLGGRIPSLSAFADSPFPWFTHSARDQSQLAILDHFNLFSSLISSHSSLFVTYKSIWYLGWVNINFYLLFVVHSISIYIYIYIYILRKANTSDRRDTEGRNETPTSDTLLVWWLAYVPEKEETCSVPDAEQGFECRSHCPQEYLKRVRLQSSLRRLSLNSSSWTWSILQGRLKCS